MLGGRSAVDDGVHAQAGPAAGVEDLQVRDAGLAREVAVLFPVPGDAVDHAEVVAAGGGFEASQLRIA